MKRITLTSFQVFKAWKIHCARLQCTVSWSMIHLHKVVSPTKLESGNHARLVPGSGTKHGCQPACLLELRCLGLTTHVRPKQIINKQTNQGELCTLFVRREIKKEKMQSIDHHMTIKPWYVYMHCTVWKRTRMHI